MIKPAVKRIILGLVRKVARHPAALGAAKSGLARIPWLDRRVRRLIDAQSAAMPRRLDADLLPDEARVLVHLREAMARRKGDAT